MGTTGGDREQLRADTLASGTYAVIAPQMGKQVCTQFFSGWSFCSSGICLTAFTSAMSLPRRHRVQVVAFQAMMEYMAEAFPGAFSGYKLGVRESHQRAKADTSGTAKAIVNSFSKLGAPLKEVRHQKAERKGATGTLPESCAGSTPPPDSQSDNALAFQRGRHVIHASAYYIQAH